MVNQFPIPLVAALLLSAFSAGLNGQQNDLKEPSRAARSYELNPSNTQRPPVVSAMEVPLELTGETETSGEQRDPATATMDDLELAPESYWNGSDGSGGFRSGPAFFYNSYNSDWFFWSGWSYSNISDNTTAGWTNQYSAITGEGVHPEDGPNYAVSYASPSSSVVFASSQAEEVRGCYVTNATYTALSMKHGDSFSKKFGGEDGTEEDWFMLTITGYAGGEPTGTADHYLADYRFEDPADDYIVDTWQWVDLLSLGKVDSLVFSLSSSDMGEWGMNTPAYFALDELQIAPEAPYISEVIEYVPAPGQFINTAWGSPRSAATIVGGLNGSLSLGAFGGYVVFKFGKPVENDPGNPYGIDFTIFGNAQEAWAEHGIVSVMKDENGNGLADDTWYELAGSDYFFSSTRFDHQVTYFNPGKPVATDVAWSDDLGNTGFIMTNGIQTQPYYPLTDSFPSVSPDAYTLSGTMLPDLPDTSDPVTLRSSPKPFGYADNRTRGVAPYTLPDNPYTAEKEHSGGDPFDIGWAVDDSGEYVDLDAVDFIRVHTAVQAHAGWLGEMSTEIVGAVDVEPAEDITGAKDVIVIRELPDTIRGDRLQLEAFAFHEGRRVKNAGLDWEASLDGADVDADNMLTFSVSGELVLTATLQGKASLQATVSTVIEYADPLGVPGAAGPASVSLYPNPAEDYMMIHGCRSASVVLCNIAGRTLLEVDRYEEGTAIPLDGLSAGMYLVRIRSGEFESVSRLIKR